MMSNKTTRLDQIAELPVRKYQDTIGSELAQKIIDLLNPWKPIETAPRDGTPVNLWYGKGEHGFEVHEVWWTEDDCWSNVTDDNWYSHWRSIIGPNEEKLLPAVEEDAIE